MIVVMEENATEEQITGVVDRLVNWGFDIHRSTGARYTILGAVGAQIADTRDIELLAGVHEVIRVSAPYKLASRAFKPEGTRIKIRDVIFGGDEVVVMAGPCTVESREQVEAIAAAVASQNVRVMRGGAFKPRTSPYSFQGLGEQGLRYLREAADRHGMLTISEIMESSQIPMFIRYVDILQVGARNMQNFNLLKDLAKLNKPVLLKRGPASTIEETLLSAEYLMSGGNHEVVICERGIRNVRDLHSQHAGHIGNPGNQEAFPPPHCCRSEPRYWTSRQGSANGPSRRRAGADGLLIEVHHDPERALCDGAQSLMPDQFARLMDQLRLIAPAVERKI
jgi:3-deoxy-7-phosphoheptulonate synthase